MCIEFADEHTEFAGLGKLKTLARMLLKQVITQTPFLLFLLKDIII
jgi:hypothetical protein